MEKKKATKELQAANLTTCEFPAVQTFPTWEDTSPSPQDSGGGAPVTVLARKGQREPPCSHGYRWTWGKQNEGGLAPSLKEQ